MLDVTNEVGEDSAALEAARAAIRIIVAREGSELGEAFRLPWNSAAFLGIVAGLVAMLYLSHVLMVGAERALSF